ncbi:hypothetical protein FCV25MIE_16160 [Fagus crenata]
MIFQNPRNGKINVFERVDFSQQGQPRVHMVEGGPRPTRKTDFHWTPSIRTLCITKDEGTKRAACWVNTNSRPNGLSAAPGPIQKQAVAPLPLGLKPSPKEPLTPNPRQIRSIVEPMVQWGQPSFFSCLDLSYERGEASSDTRVEVTTLVSPTKNSHVRRKFKEWWIPVPSILTASVTQISIKSPMEIVFLCLSRSLTHRLFHWCLSTMMIPSMLVLLASPSNVFRRHQTLGGTLKWMQRDQNG